MNTRDLSTHAAETSVGRFVFTFDAFELTDEHRQTVRMGFPNEPSTALILLAKRLPARARA